LANEESIFSNSVKYFMKYRKMGDGLFSERSLKEALVEEN